jgi:hypothetical protein
MSHYLHWLCCTNNPSHFPATLCTNNNRSKI